MPRDPAGLSAAIAALDPEGRLDDEPSQEDLFASSPLIGGHEALLVPEAKRGRPLGALNKTTEAWRGFILARYRSPLLFLADIAAADTVGLAKHLGCTKLEAINLQKAAAAELAPYLHRKQPIAIDAGEDKELPFIQQVIVGTEALAHLFPKKAGNTGAFDVAPLDADVQVAPGKSHEAGEGERNA